MRNVARKGDPTSTGGAIQDGDSSWLSEGSPSTYIGMIATCLLAKSARALSSPWAPAPSSARAGR